MRLILIGTAQPGKATCVTKWWGGRTCTGRTTVHFVAISHQTARLATRASGLCDAEWTGIPAIPRRTGTVPSKKAYRYDSGRLYQYIAGTFRYVSSDRCASCRATAGVRREVQVRKSPLVRPFLLSGTPPPTLSARRQLAGTAAANRPLPAAPAVHPPPTWTSPHTSLLGSHEMVTPSRRVAT